MQICEIRKDEHSGSYGTEPDSRGWTFLRTSGFGYVARTWRGVSEHGVATSCFEAVAASRQYKVESKPPFWVQSTWKYSTVQTQEKNKAHEGSEFEVGYLIAVKRWADHWICFSVWMSEKWRNVGIHRQDPAAVMTSHQTQKSSLHALKLYTFFVPYSRRQLMYPLRGV